MTDETGLPVKFELGAKAEFSATISTEIPSASTGRFVDMVTDIFRPFSEARGLKADQIRLQREDVLYEIATRANRRLAFERPTTPLDLKFLVPFLEKASTENPSSILVDWWAGLLSGTLSGRSAQHPLFVDFLAKLTPAEAILLQRMWNEATHVSIGSVESRDVVSKLIDDTIGDRHINGERYEVAIGEVLSAIPSEASKRGVLIHYCALPGKSGLTELVQDELDLDTLDRCVAIGVLNKNSAHFPIPTPFIGEFRCSIEYYSFSRMGHALMSACHGD